MRRAPLMTTAAVVLLTGCGGGDVEAAGGETAASTTTAAPDGTQTYRSVDELRADLADQDVDCDQAESTTSLYAIAQGRCYIDGAETVVQLWSAASDRDARVAEQIGLLSPAGLTYCYIVGRGATGTWSVNASSSTDSCLAVRDALGGDQLEG